MSLMHIAVVFVCTHNAATLHNIVNQAYMHAVQRMNVWPSGGSSVNHSTVIQMANPCPLYYVCSSRRNLSIPRLQSVRGSRLKKYCISFIFFQTRQQSLNALSFAEILKQSCFVSYHKNHAGRPFVSLYKTSLFLLLCLLLYTSSVPKNVHFLQYIFLIFPLEIMCLIHCLFFCLV